MIHNGLYKVGDPGIAVILSHQNLTDYYIHIST